MIETMCFQMYFDAQRLVLYVLCSGSFFLNWNGYLSNRRAVSSELANFFLVIRRINSPEDSRFLVVSRQQGSPVITLA